MAGGGKAHEGDYDEQMVATVIVMMLAMVAMMMVATVVIMYLAMLMKMEMAMVRMMDVITTIFFCSSNLGPTSLQQQKAKALQQHQPCKRWHAELTELAIWF